MKNNENLNINDPGIAILLNAWEELSQPIQQECFDTTLDVIDNMSSLSTILLAGVHFDLNQDNQGPNKWYDHAKQIFVDEQGVDWIRRFWNKQSNFKFATPNKKIKDHNYQGKLCILVQEQWELEYLINHYLTQEKNIWFFGSGLGVRRDPVGWGPTCDLIKHKHIRPMHLLTHQKGITVNTQSHTDFRHSQFTWVPWGKTDWQPIDNNFLVKTSLDWQIPPWQ
jgi:hypothetical protein